MIKNSLLKNSCRICAMLDKESELKRAEHYGILTTVTNCNIPCHVR
jgi:hypothetical protein